MKEGTEGRLGVLWFQEGMKSRRLFKQKQSLFIFCAIACCEEVVHSPVHLFYLVLGHKIER